MATGSPDYWMTKNNMMNTVLSAIKDAVAEGGALCTALDSMDGKLDGVIDLYKLTDAETGLLAKLFTIDTVDANGKNLLTKLDALDGKIDGRMDLDKMELMSIFYNAGTSKARLQETVENLDGTIGTLKSSIDELVGVHEDTTKIVAYGEEDWTGTGGEAAQCTVLVSDVNVKRNMLKLTNTSAMAIRYARTAGGDYEGIILAGNSATFHSSAGVWVSEGSNSWSAHEEWAT